MTWIPRVLLFFGMAIRLVQTTDWVDDVTKYIADESGARQVMVVTNLAGKEGTASPIIDEAFAKLGEKLPVVRTNIADDEDERNTSCVDAAGNPIPLTSTATFFLLLHDFRDAGLILPSTSFIDAVAEMTSFDYQPRYLLLCIAPVLSESLEELLQYAWTKKMLDFTILQWVEKKPSTHFKTENAEFSPPIVHQLNPFQQEYRRSNWSSNSGGLFPTKVGNMAGYPLKVMVSNSQPFSVGTFNELDEPIFVGGVNVLLIQAISQELNASLQYIPFRYPKDTNVKPSDAHIYFYTVAEDSDIDINDYLYPRPTISRCTSLRTTAITVDELCAVVPILTVRGSFDATALLAAVLFSFAIIVIYWIVARVLRLSVSIWQPFIIARVFFGTSVLQQPRRTVDGVMLTSLLVISAIYSSNIYSALADISLLTTGEMVFETIEDLDNSGLVPLVRPYDTNKTFHDAKGALKSLMVKSNVSLNGVSGCVQRVIAQKNVTCFMEKSRAMVLVAKSTTNGHPMVKLAKPCFWSNSVGFNLGKRSPYRSSIDIVISRMQSAGLIDKLYEDAINEAVERNNYEDVGENDGRDSTIAFRHQFLSLAIGCYTISLLVFIAEIVVDRVSKYVKSRRQAVVHIPYTE